MATRAPASHRARANAWPRPRLPPGTTATLPSRRKLSSTVMAGRAPRWWRFACLRVTCVYLVSVGLVVGRGSDCLRRQRPYGLVSRVLVDERLPAFYPGALGFARQRRGDVPSNAAGPPAGPDARLRDHLPRTRRCPAQAAHRPDTHRRERQLGDRGARSRARWMTRPFLWTAVLTEEGR